jgi:hypothetical protein
VSPKVTLCSENDDMGLKFLDVVKNVLRAESYIKHWNTTTGRFLFDGSVSLENILVRKIFLFELDF